MAYTPEEKVARTLARVFDSASLSTRLAARFTINNMPEMVQSKFFDFIMYCIAEFHSQGNQSFTGYRPEIIRAVYEGIESTGYQLEEYSPNWEE